MVCCRSSHVFTSLYVSICVYIYIYTDIYTSLHVQVNDIVAYVFIYVYMHIHIQNTYTGTWASLGEYIYIYSCRALKYGSRITIHPLSSLLHGPSRGPGGEGWREATVGTSMIKSIMVPFGFASSRIKHVEHTSRVYR